MTRKFDRFFTGSDATKLKRNFAIRTEDEYRATLEMLVGAAIVFQRHGVMDLPLAHALSHARLGSIIHRDFRDWLGDFPTVTMRETFVKGLMKFTEYSGPDHKGMTIILSDYDDPYLRPFDEYGDEAEVDENLKDIPGHHNWGDSIMLMSHERLRAEMANPDYLRMLHRTPYRPCYLSSGAETKALREAALKEAT